MTSIRIPPALLARLHRAAPPGVSLAAVVEAALTAAGGPEALRAQVEAPRLRAAARARIRRLVAARDRSVWLDSDQQMGLAEAAGAWCRLLEDQGLRVFDPARRTLRLGRAPARPRGGPRYQATRGLAWSP